MRSMTFLVNDRSTGGAIPAVAVTITENADGSLSFAISVLGSYTGELRGFFFDLADESRIGTLAVTPTSPGLTEFQQGNDTVNDLGGGANMNGLVGSDGGYDAGIEIGTAGAGRDDIQSLSFTLTSSAGRLTLDDLANVDFGLRLSGGELDDAVKLLETTAPAIDALDDSNAIAEDQIPGQVAGNVFSNDANLAAEHFVTAVGGDAANVGRDIVGTYGTLRLNRDGTYTFTLNEAAQTLAAGQQETETFSYTAQSFDEPTSSSTDSAQLSITVTGANDAPVIVAGVTSGRAFEDGSRSASGQLSALDVDQGHSLSWSIDNPATLTNPAYRFLIDNFSIRRNDAFYFNDTFGDGIAPPAGPGIPGELAATSPFPPNTPANYTLNGTFQEANGRVILDGSRSVEVEGTGTATPRFATSARLLSNNSNDPANLGRGLKIDDSFVVEGRFDLVLAMDAGDTYGIRLSDSGGGVTGSDIVQVAVRRTAAGDLEVALVELDGPSDTSITRGRVALAPLEGENQIVLRLSHDPANPGVIHASFDLVNGAAVRHFDVPGVGQIFGTGTPETTDDEIWTRAEFRAVANGLMQNGQYGTLSINANGAWSYELNNAAANVQALAQDEHVTDTFTVRVTDEHGASDTQTVTIDVTGSNDLPVITGGTSFGFVAEDTPSQTASGQLFASDPDHGAMLRWSAGPTTLVPVGAGSQFFGYSSNFHFTLDQLTIERNGATIFEDTFSDGIAPPSAPNFANGTTANYLGTAGYVEAGGRLHLDGATSFALRGVDNPVLSAGQLPVLATNIDPNDPTRGLKSDDSFSVEGRFDLVAPGAGQAYGIALTDNAGGALPADQLGDDTLTLLVRRAAGGGLIVQFNQLDIVADSATTLAARALELETGENQIALRLVHDVANVGVVRAEFDLLGGAGGPRTFELSHTGHIFDDENWTRAQLVAFGPDTYGESTTFRGTYGSLTVQQNGTWTYTLDNNAANVQALPGPQPGPVPLPQDIISVRVIDEYGTSSFRPVFINVAGTNDAPVIAGTTSGQVYEDGAARTASGQLAHGDVDQGAVVTWSLTGPATLLGQASVDATGRWTYTLDNTRFATQQLAQDQVASETFTLRATDQHGAFDDQTVTVSVGGTGDRPNLPPAPLVLQASEDGAPARGTASAFDIDSTDLLHWSLNRGSTLGYFSDHEFKADSFSVSRNGAQIFHDPFGDGFAPPSAPNFANNTMANYSAAGFFREIDGKLVMRGSDAAAFRGTGNDALVVGHEAILVTNADPTNTVNGLKKNHQFVVEGVFDLIEPQLAGQAYGLTLTDAVGQVADDLLGLTVRRNPVDGQVYVQLANNSAIFDTSALVERDLLVAGGADQIRLILGHEADAGDVSASYELLTRGVVTGGGSLGQVGIFGTDTPGFAGDDENWIRAGLFSNAIDLGEFVQNLAGAYGTLTVSNPVVHNVGELVYTPGAGAQALAQNETAVDSFFVRAVDPTGMSSSQRVEVIVTGANDAPDISGGTTSGLVYEDGGRVARGQITAIDVDNGPDMLTWEMVSPAARGDAQIDANGNWTYILRNQDQNLVQALGQGHVVTDAFRVRARDEHFASDAQSEQTVTIEIRGTNDRPAIFAVNPPPQPPSVNEDGALSLTRQIGTFDIDGLDTRQLSVSHGTPVGYRSNFLFAADEFTITRGGAQVLHDTFSDSVIPNFGPNPLYQTTGQLTESGDKLIFDGSKAGTFRGAGFNGLVAGMDAVWRTSADTANDLNRGEDFTVEALFDLAIPAGLRSGYGLSLSDAVGGPLNALTTQTGDDGMDFAVRRNLQDGLVYVQLTTSSAATDSSSLVERVLLPLGTSADQIRLRLEHEAGSDEIHASFVLLDDGAPIAPATTFATPALLFGANTPGFPADDEAYTRASLSVNGIDANEGTTTLAGTYGTLTVLQDPLQNGSYTYTLYNDAPHVQALAQGELAFDRFHVRVTDARGFSAPHLVNVNVSGTNDPVAITSGAQHGDVVEDAHETPATDDSLIVVGTITFTDVDLRDGHTPTFAPAPGNATALGTFLLGGVNEAPNTANGSVAWTYTLDNTAAQFLGEGATATEVYLVTVRDDFGATATQEVTITVHGTADAGNRPPVAFDIAFSTDEDVALSRFLMATDADGDVLSFELETAPEHGTALVTADGSFTYTPADDYSGPDSFEFLVDDGQGGQDVGTVTLGVVPVADTPSLTVPQGAEFLIAHDTGVTHSEYLPKIAALNDGGFVVTWYEEGPSFGAGVRARIFGDSAHSAQEFLSDNALGFGRDPAVTQLENGSVAFVWNGGQSVVARILDLDETMPAEAFPLSAAPGAILRQPELAASTGSEFLVTWTAFSRSGDTFLGEIFGQRANDLGALEPSFRISPETFGGTQYQNSPVASLDDGYVVLYAQYQSPLPAEIRGQIYDQHGDAIGLPLSVGSAGHVEWPDVAALAGGGFVATWAGPSPVNGNLEIFARRFTADGAPLDGEAIVVSTDEPQLWDQQDFVPSVAATADGGFAIVWYGYSAPSPADPRSYDILLQRFAGDGTPIGGEVVLNASPDSPLSLFNSLYHPDIAQLASGDLVVTWNEGVSVAGQTVVNVVGRIVGESGGLVTDEDVPVGLQISAALNDTDGSETLALTISGVPQGARLSSGIDNGNGSWSLAPWQLPGLMLTPATNSHEDITLTVTATATEVANGDQASITKSFGITVNPVNDRPVAVFDFAHTSEDEAVVVTVLANDFDVDGDAIRVTAHDGASVNGAVITFDPLTQTFQYDPTNAPALQALNDGDVLVDTFTYAITDEVDASFSATVQVNVRGITDGGNRPPIANADNNDHDGVIEAGVDFLGRFLPGDPTASGNVILGGLFGGQDIDPDGDALRVTAVNGMQAQVGVPLVLTYGALTINEDGGWTYTLDNSDPQTNALRQFVDPGFEQVTYTVSDPGGAAASALLSIRIAGTNDAPLVRADSNSTTEDATAPVTGNVFDNDSDPEGAALQIFAPPNPIRGAYGNLTLNPNGTYSYQVDPVLVNFLAAGEVVQDVFEGDYSVSDGMVFTQATRLDIAITGTAEAPSEADASVFEDGERKANGHVDLGGAQISSITGAGPNTPWAEYRFRIDTLAITRDGTQFFTDGFDGGGPPPQAPGFPLGTPGYFTSGTFSETGGRANMDGTLAAQTVVGFAGHVATFNTDISADATQGLKRNHDIRLEARFDLVLPEEELQTYGIRLTDAGVPGGGDDIVEVAVRRLTGGSLAVILRESDVAGATPVTLQEIALNAAPSDNRIVLRLEHSAGSDEVRASFNLVNGDVVGARTDFASTGHIFGNEDWTRAQFLAFSPAQTQNGRFGTLSVEADGDWSYSLRNGISSVQALAQGERVTDEFTVNITGPGGTSAQTIAVDVVGTNDFPSPTIGFSTFFPGPAPFSGTYVVEGVGPQTNRGFAFGNDVDHSRPVQWSVTANAAPPAQGQVAPAYRSDYLFKIDELRITRDDPTVPDDNTNFLVDTFNTSAPPASAPTFSYLSPTTGVFTTDGQHAVMEGQRAGSIGGVGTSDLLAAHVAVLDTNISASSPGRGLKSHYDFVVEARFELDFLPSTGQAFGVALSDRAVGEIPPDQIGDDIVGLMVMRDAGGNLIVQFDERDAVADSITIIGSETLDDQSPAAGSEIVLRLEHDTGDFGRVQASFDVLEGGTSVQHGVFVADPERADRIFGAETPGNAYDDEVWTRVQFIASGRDSAGMTAQGRFGTLRIEDDGDWTYTLNNADPDTQNLGQGVIGMDSFNWRATDAYGASTSRTFNVNVVGTDPSAPGGDRTGTTGNDVLVGSPQPERLTGGMGSDLLVGLDGQDTFDFNNINEGVDTIQDFTPGRFNDVLDISDVIDYMPPVPVPGMPPVPPPVPFNYVRLGQFQTADGTTNTQVMVNADGIGEDFFTLANLIGTGGLTLEQMIADGNLWLA